MDSTLTSIQQGCSKQDSYEVATINAMFTLLWECHQTQRDEETRRYEESNKQLVASIQEDLHQVEKALEKFKRERGIV